MTEHYIITVDRGRLRIYAEHIQEGQTSPQLDLVESLDFPGSVERYTDNETDHAGRFPGSKGHPGMSIDERLPMQREYERRRIAELAVEINSFLASRPGASWDFAATPEIHSEVLENISDDARKRLRHSLHKDLTKQSSADLLAFFSSSV